jgi:hypothetical protein
MLSTVPDVIFKTRVRDESIGADNPFRWQDVSTDDIFKGKKLLFWLFLAPIRVPAPANICLVMTINIRKSLIRGFLLLKC